MTPCYYYTMWFVKMVLIMIFITNYKKMASLPFKYVNYQLKSVGENLKQYNILSVKFDSVTKFLLELSY